MKIDDSVDISAVNGASITRIFLLSSQLTSEPTQPILLDMTITADTAAIESIRAFAEQHGEIEFAHLCTAALTGEEWAVERVTAILAEIAKYGNPEKARLFAVRNADTTRPDGAIARSVEV